MDPKQIVADGYDRIAETYAAWSQRGAHEPGGLYRGRATGPDDPESSGAVSAQGQASDQSDGRRKRLPVRACSGRLQRFRAVLAWTDSEVDVDRTSRAT